MRILDTYGPALAGLRGRQLFEAILETEGRVLAAEVEGIASGAPFGYDRHTSGAEMAAAFGADMVMVNVGMPARPGPVIAGLEDLNPVPEGFGGLVRLLGRPCGPILEPDLPGVPEGTRATAQTARATLESGATFAVITVNPCRGAVSNQDLLHAVEGFRKGAPDLLLIAGKMHHSGLAETYAQEIARQYIQAGADGVIIPVPGTVPGVGEEMAAGFVAAAHAAGGLALSAITTSQEGSDPDTLRRLALCAKRIGADIHHISTAGYPIGAPPPENLYAYSVAVRGVRHTWNRMARNLRSGWEAAND